MMPVLVIISLVVILASVIGVGVLRSTKLKPLVRHLVAGTLIVVASGPGSLIITLLLQPVWTWLEAAFGIEAVGHSGPAAWCYAATFVVCVLFLGGMYGFTATKSANDAA